MTGIVTPEGSVLEVDAFLARYVVQESDLGRWIRAAIDEALDRAIAEHR